MNRDASATVAKTSERVSMVEADGDMFYYFLRSCSARIVMNSDYGRKSFVNTALC